MSLISKQRLIVTLSRNTWYAKWYLRWKVLFWMYIYTQLIIYWGCGYSFNATHTPRSTKAMAYQHKNYHYRIWRSHGDLINRNAIPEMMVFILKWAPTFGIWRWHNSLIICDECLQLFVTTQSILANKTWMQPFRKFVTHVVPPWIKMI